MGIKFYLIFLDEKIIEEFSKVVGKIIKCVVICLWLVGCNLFVGCSMFEWMEEMFLLFEDEVCCMDFDDIVLVVDV